MSPLLQRRDYGPGDPVPAEPEAFLRELAGPALIRVPGRGEGRCRMLVTLLHGNEPSGLVGVHRFLRERVATGYRPRVDLWIAVAGVENALRAPLFSVRQAPGERDLNRCFASTGGDPPGRLAGELLAWIRRLQPEAVIDVHNTSGNGPSFCVCSELGLHHLALGTLFSHRVVVTDLRLGALMEQSSPGLPIVTVECGGADSETAHEVAWEGLNRFAETGSLLGTERVGAMMEELDIYRHPVRLELAPDTRVRFGDDPSPDADIVLPADIDQRNFGMVTPDIPLGRVNRPGCLRLKGGDGYLPIDEYFLVRRGRLHAAHPLKLFMMTTRPEIALSDCLLYAVKELDHRPLLEAVVNGAGA